MKMLKLWIAAIGFSGILPLVSAAQETVPRIVTPSSASVTAEGSQRLFSGQDFSFTLQFDKAPQDHRGGEINYQFDNVRYTKPFNPFDLVGYISKSGKTELIDGRAEYKDLKLHITDLMLPGTWKLVKVTLGRTIQTPVSIPDNITFEIPEMPPVAVSIDAPSRVRAGQQFKVKFTLDRYPKELTQGCVLWLSVNLPGGLGSGTPTNGVPLNVIELKPDQPSYEMSGSFDTEFPGGPWQGEVKIFANRPSSNSGYQPNRKPEDFCRAPRLEGDVRLEGEVRFTLTVEPDSDLVTPTSVAVVVNPSQIKLLREEADHLRVKAQHLKQQLITENTAANQALLRNSVDEAMIDLDKTEAAYKGLYKTGSDHKEYGGEPSYSKAVKVFFDDIRFEYDAARKTLSDNLGQLREDWPRLEHVSAALGGSPPRLNPASIKVLDSILHTAKAYDLAASAGTMIRDLDVRSVPVGATVSYWQRTDPEPKTLDQVTDSTIKGLYRAHYSIRFQKQGYEEQVITFDGGESTSASVIARLSGKGDAR